MNQVEVILTLFSKLFFSLTNKNRLYFIGPVFVLISHASLMADCVKNIYVVDHKTGQAVSNVRLKLESKEKVLTTDGAGFALIYIEKNKEVLNISHPNYFPRAVLIDCDEGEEVRIRLTSNILPEIIKREKAIYNEASSGLTSINIKEMQSLPAMGGETDIMRSLSILPGIAQGQELSAGLWVRGGSPDQNLILLDDIPLFNPAHFGGIASAFNMATLDGAQLYKGLYPAKYGGRLSSVLDLRGKSGEKQKWKKGLGLGILTSDVFLSGPLKKDTTSIIFGARGSFPGSALLSYFQNVGNTQDAINYKFYDLHFRLSHIDKRGGVWGFTTYSSGDFLRAEIESRQNVFQSGWGNLGLGATYRNQLGRKSHLKTNAYYSSYSYGFLTIEDQLSSMPIQWRSSGQIAETGLKSLIETGLSDLHRIEYGVQFINRNNLPRKWEDNQESHFFQDWPRLKSFESSLFAHLYLFEASGIRPNLGLRMVHLNTEGHDFLLPEPRASISFVPWDHVEIFTGYSRMHQSVHWLSQLGFGLPNETWLNASAVFPPSKADQFEIGSQVDYKGYEVTISGYYKKLNNLTDVKEGTAPFTDPMQDYSEGVEGNGTGTSYGLEFLLHKSFEDFTLWLSYTYSRTFFQFHEINNGKSFLSPFDRPHDLSLVGKYFLSPKISITGQWTFQSGRLFTLPTGMMYDNMGERILLYEGRNNQRIKNFSRLDVGLTYDFASKNGIKNSLQFGVVNLTGRLNPMFINPRENANSASGSLEFQVVGGIPFLPYVKYSIAF